MSQSKGKPVKAHVEPIGVGVGWSNPIQVSGLGRSGEITNLEVRGDVGDATAGVMTLMLFEAPIPKDPADYASGRVVLATALDPATIADGDQALRITGLVIAADAVISSDIINVRDITKSTTFYAVERPDRALFLAISGVTGRVHTYLRGEGG